MPPTSINQTVAESDHSPRPRFVFVSTRLHGPLESDELPSLILDDELNDSVTVAPLSPNTAAVSTGGGVRMRTSTEPSAASTLVAVLLTRPPRSATRRDDADPAGCSSSDVGWGSATNCDRERQKHRAGGAPVTVPCSWSCDASSSTSASTHDTAPLALATDMPARSLSRSNVNTSSSDVSDTTADTRMGAGVLSITTSGLKSSTATATFPMTPLYCASLDVTSSATLVACVTASATPSFSAVTNTVCGTAQLLSLNTSTSGSTSTCARSKFSVTVTSAVGLDRSRTDVRETLFAGSSATSTYSGATSMPATSSSNTDSASVDELT